MQYSYYQHNIFECLGAKNSHADMSDDVTSGHGGVRMYSTGLEDCPVAALKTFLRRRNPNINSLFQTPKLM